MSKIKWIRITGLDLVPLAIRVSMGKTLLNPEKYLPPENAIFDMGKLREALVNSVRGPEANNGYESLLEFIDITFLAECSRVCTHELVRHRIASYTQSSTRYILHTARQKGYTPDDIAYAILPAEIAEDYIWLFEEGIDNPKLFDNELRYYLPLATRSHILVKMNLRSVLNMLVLRLHPRAHWEIRELAHELACRIGDAGIPVFDMLARKKPGLMGYYERLRGECGKYIHGDVEAINTGIGEA